MIDRSRFQTASRMVQLGNEITKLKNRKTRDMGLTATQSEALRYILKHYDEKELTAADLMEHLQLSQSTVAGVLQRLEGKGIVARYTAANDSRKSVILPTAKGQELHEALKQNAVETERCLLRGMSREEQAALNRLLQKALENLRTAEQEVC